MTRPDTTCRKKKQERLRRIAEKTFYTCSLLFLACIAGAIGALFAGFSTLDVANVLARGALMFGITAGTLARFVPGTEEGADEKKRDKKELSQRTESTTRRENRYG